MKKTGFITGVTGVWGYETIKLFAQHLDAFHVRALARDTDVNRAKMAPFMDSMEIVWGDLQDKALMKECVRGADYVLAIGALVSPMADDYPEETMRTNYGSTLSMLKYIKELGQADTTHFVYVGTVAQTGDRQPPIHWGRIGDPMKPAIYDYYAVSKVFAERAVIESGLKYWVSIRQTGMMPGKPKSAQYPIAGHQPPNNVLEWSNAFDSALLMLNICRQAPEDFWRHCYNLSGGADYRQSSSENLASRGMTREATGDPNWFAQYNFHGQYYLDADALEQKVHFRTLSLCEAQKKVQEYFMAQMKAAGIDPTAQPRPTIEQQRENNRKIFSLPGGTLRALADKDDLRVRAWYGSWEKYAAIPATWDEVHFLDPDALRVPQPALDRGFDESKPVSELDITDMQAAAAFRGGACLSETMTKGDLYTDLTWRSARGSVFQANPYAVLFAGHWCEDDYAEAWRYGAMAKENPFFAQVWTPLHADEEDYSVDLVVDPRKIAEEYK